MQANPSDAVISALESNGAALFARLVYRSNKLLNLLNNNQVNLILAPLDYPLQEFLSQHQNLDENILENHFSLAKDMSGKPLPAVNGSLIHVDKISLQNYRIVNRIQIGDIAIIFIQVVLTTPQQVQSLTARNSGAAPFRGQNFEPLILHGQIKGNDRIALCNTHRETNRLCNKDDGALFRKLLQQEFGIALAEGEDPREQYILHHNSFYTNYGVGGIDFRTIKVSENRHIQSAFLRNYIFCLGTDHVLKCYYKSTVSAWDRNVTIKEVNLGISEGASGNIVITGPLPPIKKMVIGHDQLVLNAMDGTQYTFVKEGQDRPSFQFVTSTDRILDYDYLTALVQAPNGKKYIKGTLYAHTDDFNDFRNDDLVEVPVDAISLISQGKAIILKELNDESCRLQDVRNKEIIDLGDFRGGSFQCSKRKLFWYAKRENPVVMIINHFDELWISNDNARDWQKVQMPENSKVIDVSTELAEDHQGYKVIIVLDEQGRIYHLTKEQNNIILTLVRTIPALLRIVSFKLSHPEMAGTNTILQMKY